MERIILLAILIDLVNCYTSKYHLNSEISHGYCTHLLDVSFNQPMLSSCAVWSSNGTTFVSSPTIGSDFLDIFIDTNDTIYFADTLNNRILIWLAYDTNASSVINGSFKRPYSLFVTVDGDIYIDDGKFNNRIVYWTSNSTSSVTGLGMGGSCYGLFVDINGALYCSSRSDNIVVKISLSNAGVAYTIIAGDSRAGQRANELDSPQGIFVDESLILYVADSNNDRVQMLQPGNTSGTTIPTGAIILDTPTDVALDGEGHLYVVDSRKGRIIAGKSSNFRCVVGCSSGTSASNNQLNRPQAFSFDSHGNIFVTDRNNGRIQIFYLLTNVCGKFVNR